jgi:hypothetical protein
VTIIDRSSNATGDVIAALGDQRNACTHRPQQIGRGRPGAQHDMVGAQRLGAPPDDRRAALQRDAIGLSMADRAPACRQRGAQRIGENAEIGDLARPCKAHRARNLPAARQIADRGELVRACIAHAGGADIGFGPEGAASRRRRRALPGDEMAVLAQQVRGPDTRGHSPPGGHRARQQRRERARSASEALRRARPHQAQCKRCPGPHLACRERERAARMQPRPGAADRRQRGKRLDLLDRDMPGIAPGCTLRLFLRLQHCHDAARALQLQCRTEADKAPANDESGRARRMAAVFHLAGPIL